MAEHNELAWAAGFFDGEGNIRWNPYSRGKNRMHQREYGTPTLQIGQCHRFVLDRFAKAVGVGKSNGPYQKKDRTKPYFTFGVSGHKAKETFEKIKPFLSTVKIRQGELVLRKWAKQLARPRSKYDHSFKK